MPGKTDRSIPRISGIHKTDRFIIRELAYRYGKVMKHYAFQIRLADGFPLHSGDRASCLAEARKLDQLAAAYRLIIRDMVDYGR